MQKILSLEEVIIQPVYEDWKCFYRAISLYFTNDEAKYKIIREIIYETAKETKENLKPNFLNELYDNILADYKVENQIE